MFDVELANIESSWSQGDQIGRKFAQGAIVYISSYFKITEAHHIFGSFIPWVKLGHKFGRKMSWAKFWAIFS
jgi:hypothetical protein